ncbi:MAG: DUF5685 family protein [Clostridia bacterium]
MVMKALFGYVKAYKPEMKVKDYEVYKGVYCSLCRQLGRDYGIMARMALSYDFAFLALLRMAVSDECPGFDKGRCPFNPMAKCHYCRSDPGGALEISAACVVIMTYYKLYDNIADSSRLKSLAYRLLLPFAARARKKACRKFPQVDEILGEAIASQAQLEREQCPSIDQAADPTARALAHICKLGFEGTDREAYLERLGYCIGRYVYICDAADDYAQDAKNGNYNVFLLEGMAREEASHYAGEVLNLTVSEAINAYKSLSLTKFQDILLNILYDGTYHVITEITDCSQHQEKHKGRCSREKRI